MTTFGCLVQTIMDMLSSLPYLGGSYRYRLVLAETSAAKETNSVESDLDPQTRHQMGCPPIIQPRFLMQANLKTLGAATLVLITYTLTSSTLISEPLFDSLILDSISDET